MIKKIFKFNPLILQTTFVFSLFIATTITVKPVLAQDINYKGYTFKENDSSSNKGLGAVKKVKSSSFNDFQTNLPSYTDGKQLDSKELDFDPRPYTDQNTQNLLSNQSSFNIDKDKDQDQNQDHNKDTDKNKDKDIVKNNSKNIVQDSDSFKSQTKPNKQKKTQATKPISDPESDSELDLVQMDPSISEPSIKNQLKSRGSIKIDPLVPSLDFDKDPMRIGISYINSKNLED